jgi:hypothetical protein
VLFELHIRGQRGSKQRHYIRDNRQQRDCFAFRVLFAAEQKNLADQFVGARAGILDFLEVGARRCAVRRLHAAGFGVGCDDRQQIVEVMRNSARQCPQRIHLLRLLQLIPQ